VQFTTHAFGPLGQLSVISPLVPASNGGGSPSWVPELYPSYSHSDLQCVLHLLELHPLLQICTVWSSSSNCPLELCSITDLLELCPVVVEVGVEVIRITTDCQSDRLSWCRAPIWSPWPDLSFRLTIAGFLMWGALSDERMGLARSVTLGLKSRRTHGHILLYHLRLPQPGGPDPRIYISQGQGTAPDTGFHFCRLLRLAGLRCSYYTPPPHGNVQ
jgi:hypothetical protein